MDSTERQAGLVCTCGKAVDDTWEVWVLNGCIYLVCPNCRTDWSPRRPGEALMVNITEAD